MKTPFPTRLTFQVFALMFTIYKTEGADVEIHATNDGNGRFAEFSHKQIYPRFQFHLLPVAQGQTVDTGNLNPNGGLTLKDPANLGVKLEWFWTGPTDGYLLMPAAIDQPFNHPEARFKPKTSGDFKVEVSSRISERVRGGTINGIKEAAQLLVEAENIVNKVSPAQDDEPGETERAFLSLLKDIGDAARNPSNAGQPFEYATFTTDALVKVIQRSSDYATSECYKFIGDALGLWMKIHDKYSLKGTGSKAWGNRAMQDAAVFHTPVANTLFRSQLIGMIQNLQGNYNKTESTLDGLKERISRNLKAAKVPDSIKEGLGVAESLLALDLADVEDQAKLDAIPLGKIELMIDSLQHIVSPKSF